MANISAISDNIGCYQEGPRGDHFVVKVVHFHYISTIALPFFAFWFLSRFLSHHFSSKPLHALPFVPFSLHITERDCSRSGPNLPFLGICGHLHAKHTCPRYIRYISAIMIPKPSPYLDMWYEQRLIIISADINSRHIGSVPYLARARPARLRHSSSWKSIPIFLFEFTVLTYILMDVCVSYLSI